MIRLGLPKGVDVGIGEGLGAGRRRFVAGVGYGRVWRRCAGGTDIPALIGRAMQDRTRTVLRGLVAGGGGLRGRRILRWGLGRCCIRSLLGGSLLRGSAGRGAGALREKAATCKGQTGANQQVNGNFGDGHEEPSCGAEYTLLVLDVVCAFSVAGVR